MKYAGELYFDDNDLIKVPSFIIRSESEVSFDFIANWDGQGRWRIDGLAVFNGHYYASKLKSSIKLETNAQGPGCQITFSIIDKKENFIFIKGCWFEDNESYSFSGELEQKS